MKLEISHLRELQNLYETNQSATPEAQELYKQCDDIISRFQQKFSRDRLPTMTQEEYAVGSRSRDSFCYWINFETRKVGNIFVGGSGWAFGVYYSKADSSYKIREGSTTRVVSNEEASEIVKKITAGLVELVSLAEKKAFADMIRVSKQLPLDYQVIGKILSLYLPDKYLSVYSNNHVNEFLNSLGLLDEKTSLLNLFERRDLLLGFKEKDEVMKNWPNRKYADFLYDQFHKEKNPPPPPRPAGDKEKAIPRNWWVEKTIVTGRTDRENGPYSLGKALWSPQEDKAGGRIYENMKRIKKGDVVLHFVNNENITGVSIVDKEADSSFTCLPSTEWDDGTGKRPAYMVKLKEYNALRVPIDKKDLLTDKFRSRLINIKQAGQEVFYDKDLNLRQGAYLTKAPKELVDIANETYREKTGEDLPYFSLGAGATSPVSGELSIDELSSETFLSKDFLREIESLLLEKKQLIFYGPPGTGKTFVAERFALYFAGSKERIEKVQFHPSYSYEDFVEGLKPQLKDGRLSYDVVPGPFLRFCEKAKGSSDRHVFIIDEINRGTMAKIFGELIYCLEYRNREISLQYSPEAPFKIPFNLYLIATMNSADRSIALVDYALRRRFYFEELRPDVSILAEYLKANESAVDVEKLTAFVKKINENIEQKMGREYAIGHSYFMAKHLDKVKVQKIWRYAVHPLLEEYFFNNKSELEEFEKAFDEFYASI